MCAAYEFTSTQRNPSRACSMRELVPRNPKSMTCTIAVCPKPNALGRTQTRSHAGNNNVNCAVLRVCVFACVLPNEYAHFPNRYIGAAIGRWQICKQVGVYALYTGVHSIRNTGVNVVNRRTVLFGDISL